MSDMLFMHGGGKPLDLNDPVDQIVIGCLCFAVAVIPIGILLAAAWRLKKRIGETPACPECNGNRVTLRGIVGGKRKDSDPAGWKWRCKICGAEFETTRETDASNEA